MLGTLIAKYLLAAHLALLAVAPLVLFSCVAESAVATVLLWLSTLGIVWVIMEPSANEREYAHDARRRVQFELFVNPLTYVLLVVAILALVRFVNDGIQLQYIPEASVWKVSQPQFPYLPASTNGSGYLPLAVAVASSVAILGSLTALNRQARVMLVSTIAVVAMIMAFVLIMSKVDVKGDFHLGPAFAIVNLGCAMAVAECLSCGGKRFLPPLMISIGGTFVGLVVYSTPFELLAHLVALLFMVVYGVVYLRVNARRVTELKFIGALVLSVTIGWIASQLVLSNEQMIARFVAITSEEALNLKGDESRAMLTALAFKSWMTSPWCGCGLGGFGHFCRFAADSEFWIAFPVGVKSISSGALQVLAERGIIGAAMLLLPVVLLAVEWVRGLIGCISSRRLPAPMTVIFPVLIVYAALISVFGCSLLRADVLMVAGTIAAISVAAFRSKGNEDGR